MKKFGLTSQIWLVFSLVTLLLCLILSLIFFWSIRTFFEREAYSSIEYSQELKFAGYGQLDISGLDTVDVRDLGNIRDVKHIIVLDGQFSALNLETIVKKSLGIPEGFVIPQELLEKIEKNFIERKISDGDPVDEFKIFIPQDLRDPSMSYMDYFRGRIGGNIQPAIIPLLDDIGKNAENQTETMKHYEYKTDSRKLFYVIQNRDIGSTKVTLISYIWDTYNNKLVGSLFSRLVIGMIIGFIISLIAARLLAKYLTRPLNKLSKEVRAIARRDWNKPIAIKRKDEIGELAESMELMRKSLSDQDREQQAMLQYISHELKTPVMVIRSYSQAIKDGIYPGGNLESTVDVIDREILRMDKRIKDLLFITRVDYLSRHNMETEKFSLKLLIEDVTGKFCLQKPEIEWCMNLEDVEISANPEQLVTAIENVVQNNLRYAKTIIDIRATKKKDRVRVRFYNDGPQVESTRLADLFAPFKKGLKGETGLGLNIVRKIVELHSGKVWIENEDSGVATYIELPLESREF